MAKPLIPAEAILDRALELLEAEGADALGVRRLAADLRISTRTLYRQVGNRDALIRALVARHFSQLTFEFRRYGTWEETALRWCLTLRETLREHPSLTELMTFADRRGIVDYVNELVKVALREGVPRDIAVECCRSLVNVTVNHAIVEVRAMRDPAPEVSDEAAGMAGDLAMTIGWMLAGVRLCSGEASADVPVCSGEASAGSSDVRW